MNEHDTFDPRFLPLAFPAVQMPQIRHAELLAEAERLRTLRDLPRAPRRRARTSRAPLRRLTAFLLRRAVASSTPDGVPGGVPTS